MRWLVFDSGIGGLGVAAAIRRLLPAAGLIYVADTAAFPYGSLTDAELLARVPRVIGAALEASGAQGVVVACNTASTVALDAVRAHVPVPVVGCVPPIKWAASVSRSRVIGVLATPATVRRAYLDDLVRRFAADCVVLSHGAQTLAPLAEAAFRGDPVHADHVAPELAALVAQPGGARLDAVALGCTHYPLLLPQLRAALSRDAAWLDPAEPVARRVAFVAAQASATPQARDAAMPGGTALHTGDLPQGRAARAWAAAGFPRALPLRV